VHLKYWVCGGTAVVSGLYTLCTYLRWTASGKDEAIQNKSIM